MAKQAKQKEPKQKKEKQKRTKRVKSYEEKHNRRYSWFTKSARILLWVGIFNVISLIVSLIQSVVYGYEMYFYFCFAINDLIYRLLWIYVPWFQTSVGFWFYIVIIIAIAILVTALVTIISLWGAKGKKDWLWAGLIFMAVDTFVILLCYFFAQEDDTSLWLMFSFHMIGVVAQVIALYEYYKIIDLAKEYNMLKKPGVTRKEVELEVESELANASPENQEQVEENIESTIEVTESEPQPKKKKPGRPKKNTSIGKGREDDSLEK